MCDRPSLQCQQAIDRLKSRHSHTGAIMSLADVRIAVLFFLVIGFFALFSAIFGIRGTYILYYVSAGLNAFFFIFSLIANGKL